MNLFERMIGEADATKRNEDTGAIAKTFSELMKFNPYHGKDGRFVSGSGGNYASFTYAPGKSKAHDNAIAREKERQASAGGPKAMTEQEYLDSKGVGDASSGWVLDKLRGNRQLGTQRGRERFYRERNKAEEEYQKKREQAKQEYKEKVKNGELRDKTKIERMIETANGHPDNPSTQAARRMAEKRGIDWKTGKQINKSDVSKSFDELTEFNITKADDDKRLVFGWALVSATADGQQIIDRQGDIVDPEELEEGAYEYVLNFRDAGEEHIGSLRKKARMVESVVFTEEKLQAMGIPLGTVPYGWWIGFYVDDDNTWELIKNGTYKMFSIEGRAIREPVDEPLAKADRVNGCGVLVVSNDRILTATRIGGKHRNQICGPGGHIEPGETYEEAAVREAREEFGIECKDLKPLGIMDGGRNYGKSAIFLCTEYDGKPQTDEEEMTEIKWRSLDELDGERLFKPFEQSLDLITEEVGAVAKTFSELMRDK